LNREILEREQNIEELVKAFKNLVIHLGLNIRTQADFDKYFETLCNLIRVDEKYQR